MTGLRVEPEWAVVDSARSNGHGHVDRRPLVYLPTAKSTGAIQRRALGVLGAFARTGHPVFIVDPEAALETSGGNPNIVSSIRQTPHSGVIVYANATTNNEAIEAYEKPFVLLDLADGPSASEDDGRRARLSNPMRSEHGLLRKANLVIASSPVLAERYQRSRADLIIVPDGIATKRIQGASSHPRPKDLPVVGKPLIGFIGSVTASFHFSLLEIVARRRPEWNFVIVGAITSGVEKSVARLAGLANVFFLGARPEEQLPAYLHSIDVGALWLVVNEATARTRPMRMYEYLAIGTPCVATPIPACMAESTVTTAAEPEGFGLAIDAALRSVTAQELGARLAAARQVDWAQQLAPVFQLLETQFGVG